jgi:uncharacterized protein YdhG (YjbR/CyaY superfamily)
MKIEANSPSEYIAHVPEERRSAFSKLRDVIKDNLPDGFVETMNYGMIGFVVPHDTYPNGYHCDPSLPLPFLNIASQKNFIGLYHMGIYANEDLMNWFTEEYKKLVPSKLDMGKSCIRLKKPEQIPFELIGELCQKMSVQDWIKLYESAIKK